MILTITPEDHEHINKHVRLAVTDILNGNQKLFTVEFNGSKDFLFYHRNVGEKDCVRLMAIRYYKAKKRWVIQPNWNHGKWNSPLYLAVRCALEAVLDDLKQPSDIATWATLNGVYGAYSDDNLKVQLS